MHRNTGHNFRICSSGTFSIPNRMGMHHRNMHNFGIGSLANSTRLKFALPLDGWFHKHSNHQDRFSTVSVQAHTWRFFSVHEWLNTTIAQWEFWLVPWHQFQNLEGKHGMSLPTESETEQNKLPSEGMTTVRRYKNQPSLHPLREGSVSVIQISYTIVMYKHFAN